MVCFFYACKFCIYDGIDRKNCNQNLVHKRSMRLIYLLSKVIKFSKYAKRQFAASRCLQV